VEFYAQRRAERAMRRADVTVLVLDTTVQVARLDRKIAAYALEHHHPVVIAANKWDLIPKEAKWKDFEEYLFEALPGLRWSPVVHISALEGTGVEKVLEVCWRLKDQAHTRVPTAKINKAVEEAYGLRAPRPRYGRRGTIYYGTQVDVAPPTFVLFVNDPELFESNYLRYLENQFRKLLPFPEVPLKFFLKKRPRSPAKGT
jgi:GTP-binding protein